MTTPSSLIALLCLVLLPAASVSAANHPADFVKPVPAAVLQLWPGDPPNLIPGAKPESFVDERFADVSIPQLFVYLPPKEKANGTALIICPGGGYSHLAMCLHVENVVKLLNDQGIAVFGLKYRTRYGRNDVVADALADGQRAVRMVRSRAGEWNINPHRIGVQGYSAGSNLCLNLLGHFDGGDPAAADPLAKVSSRPDFCVLMCPWPNGKKMEDYPILADAPPTFVANARDDKTAPFAFATAIDEKLKVQKIPENFFPVDTGGHGAFHYAMNTGPGQQWPPALMAWLRKLDMLPPGTP